MPSARGTSPRTRAIVGRQTSLGMIEIAEYLEPGYYTLSIGVVPQWPEPMTPLLYWSSMLVSPLVTDGSR